MSERDVMWTPTVGVGLEHLRLSQDFAGYVASGVIIGMDDGRPFSAWYGIRCDTNWRVRHVNIHMLQDGQKRIELQADGEAHWQSPSGEPLAVLDGCIDVDISATPFAALHSIPVNPLNCLWPISLYPKWKCSLTGSATPAWKYRQMADFIDTKA